MASSCIRIPHVLFIVAAYDFTRLDIVHLFNIDWCYAPISVSFDVNFACVTSNFVSVIVLSLGFNFHTNLEGENYLSILTSPKNKINIIKIRTNSHKIHVETRCWRITKTMQGERIFHICETLSIEDNN